MGLFSNPRRRSVSYFRDRFKWPFTKRQQPEIGDVDRSTQANNTPAALAPLPSLTIPIIPQLEPIAIDPIINRSNAVPPMVHSIHVSSHQTLRNIWFQLSRLELSLILFPEQRSLIAGMRMCIACIEYNSQEINEEIQEKYEAFFTELNNIVGNLRYVPSSSAESTEERPISREIQQIISRIKIRREKFKATEANLRRTIDLDREITDCRMIVRLLKQLQVTHEALNSTDEAQISMNAPSIEQWGLPVYCASYNAIWLAHVCLHLCATNDFMKIRDTIKEWANKIDGPRVFWMTGGIGTGKTTIAHSVCEILDAEQRLGASFFCSNEFPNCDKVDLIIPTIAYQLGRFSNKYMDTLSRALREPDFSKWDLSRQLDQLIAVPLASRETPSNVVIVIDALEKCSDITRIRALLEVLCQRTNLPIKFLFTSQPDISVDEIFPHHTPPRAQIQELLLGTAPPNIKQYLARVLSSVAPSLSIDQLSRRAGDLFIFATTAIQYLLSEYEIFDIEQRAHTLIEGSSINPGYPALDRLYTTILSNAFAGNNSKETETRRLVLQTIICAKVPVSIAVLADLLGLESQDVVIGAILPLWPLIHISSVTGYIFLRHASFQEFLFDSERSGTYYCDKTQHSEFLAIRCFIITQKYLRFNMCNLDDSALRNVEVPDIDCRVSKAVSSTLSHACRYWSEYLAVTGPSSETTEHLHDFLLSRLLFWMEVLSFNNYIEQRPTALARTLEWLSHIQEQDELHKLVQDAHDFFEAYIMSAASDSTPHIYISALPFVSKKSYIYERYLPQVQGQLVIKGTPEDIREEPSPITSMALSSDRTQVAVGLENGKMFIWYLHTSSLCPRSIEVDQSRIRSVVFSPNGSHIASVSDSGTIHIWDAHTGHMTSRQFAGSVSGSTEHKAGVLSVVFSVDGSQIVSGSYNGIVRVYDFLNGTLMEQKSHRVFTHSIESIMFSPDISYALAQSKSSSRPRTQLRDLGDSDRELAANIDFPGKGSTAVSPDGRSVAFGSMTGEISIWDAYSGAQLVTPFKGHTNPILSMAFSSDGRCLVSSSSDQTMRLWDSYEGVPLAPPLERLKSPSCITISPDANGNEITSILE
ncbi:unnamed protein product, partial [Rhizoctonia solani]